MEFYTFPIGKANGHQMCIRQLDRLLKCEILLSEQKCLPAHPPGPLLRTDAAGTSSRPPALSNQQSGALALGEQEV